MTSHVKCRGGYAGCLGTAHRTAILELCRVCRVAREAELKAQGKSIHGRTRPRESLLSSAISDVIGKPEPDLAKGLVSARTTMRTEAIIADAETGGQGVLTPSDRFDVMKMSAQVGGRGNLDAYVRMLGGADEAFSGKVEVNDANYLPYDMRQEIRDAVRKAVAPVSEIRATYLISEKALDQVMAEPDIPAPEEEPAPVTVIEESPTNRRAEHMAHMREARAQKKAEREAELERLRALENGKPREPLFPFHQEIPLLRWTVTVLAPTDVTVEALTFAAALKQAQDLYGSEAVIGIVKA